MDSLSDFFNEPLVEEKENVLLIDYSNLSIRNLYGLEYDPTDVTYVGYKNGMLMSIKKLVKEFKPSRLIFCMESHDGNWRKEIYPEYKANRKGERDASKIDFDSFFAHNDKFVEDLSKCMKNAQFLKIPHLEADDLIALTVMNKPEWNITLISTDKDFHQLHAYKNFKQYDPIKNEFIHVLNPSAALMEKIVRGDKNDNIPPLKKGIGTKTFSKIYQTGVEEWISMNMLQEQFDRNTKLIAFKSIPVEYIPKVVNELDNFKKEPFENRELFNLVVNNGLGCFMSKITDFCQVMKQI